MSSHSIGEELRPVRSRTPKLDQFDLKILSELQESGRMTNLNLAARIGLSATPCLQRVKRLEDAGYIQQYGAQIDISRLCTNVIVFTEITLRSHGPSDFGRFESGVRDVPQVLSAFLMTGGYDYLLQFIATDVPQYRGLIEELLRRDLGIQHYFSYIMLKQVKRFQGYPLEALLHPPARQRSARAASYSQPPP